MYVRECELCNLILLTYVYKQCNNFKLKSDEKFYKKYYIESLLKKGYAYAMSRQKLSIQHTLMRMYYTYMQMYIMCACLASACAHTTGYPPLADIFNS